MDSHSHEDKTQRSLHVPAEALNERIYSSKRSRAGFLGAVTRVRSQIEALLVNTNNERYQEAWRKFEDSHNSYL